MIAISARHGEGIPELRAEIARRVADKKATRQRIEADLRAVAARLNEECGTGKPRSLAAGRAQAMEEALADSAGVPTVVDGHRAVHPTARRTGHRLAGRLVALTTQARPAAPAAPRPRRRATRSSPAAARTSIPEATPVQRAQVDTEVRALADDVSAGMTRPWADAVRRASISRVGDMSDRLDAEIAGTDLGVARIPVWAGAVRLLQWLLILAALLGGGPGPSRSPPRARWATTRCRPTVASTCRSCCWSAAWWSASCWRCCAASWSTSRPADGPPRRTASSAPPCTRSPRSWS